MIKSIADRLNEAGMQLLRNSPDATGGKKVASSEIACRQMLRDVIHSLHNAGFPSGKGDPRIRLANALMELGVWLQEGYQEDSMLQGLWLPRVLEQAEDESLSVSVCERVVGAATRGDLMQIDALAEYLVSDCIRSTSVAP
jgi:ubiquinone biosynthesis protein COQ9